jgi:DUF438 domain-containing protein
MEEKEKNNEPAPSPAPPLNLVVELTNLWFEVFKIQIVIESLMGSLGKTIAPEVLESAHKDAFERVNSRFPFLGLKLNMPEEMASTIVKSQESSKEQIKGSESEK